MFNRLALAAAVSVLIGAPRAVVANPITYDFTGRLNEPVDGSKTFSGSFTINATPTIAPGASSVAEDGNDVSVTVNLGGYALNFVNTPQNPYYATLQVAVVPTQGEEPPGVPEVNFSVTAGDNGYVSSQFSMEFYSPWVSALPANLSSLSLPLYTSSFGISDSSEGSGGVLTSIEIASTPEPSTLVIFTGLGIGALLCRRRRDPRARRCNPS